MQLCDSGNIGVILELFYIVQRIVLRLFSLVPRKNLGMLFFHLIPQAPTIIPAGCYIVRIRYTR
jgi:hypothetical protein